MRKRIAVITHGFIESHKYNGKWDKGHLATVLLMDISISAMVAGGIFLGFKRPDIGMWLLVGGFLGFALSCFELHENYPVRHNKEDIFR